MRTLCGLAMAVALTACMHAVKGGPESVLNKQYSTATITARELVPVEAAPADENASAIAAEGGRNRIISQRLMMIDSAYEQYIRKLQREQSVANLGTDLADLALGIAGTLTGSVGAKTNYAAASALLSGSSAAINRRAFFEQTTVALVSAMNAFRAKVRYRILVSQRKSMTEYPPEEVYYDLTAYEFAGTLMGAISYVQSTAEKDKESTEAVIDSNIREIPKLTLAQRYTKGCLSRSLGEANAADLTQDRLRQAGSMLVPPLAMDNQTRDEMLVKLQDRIRKAEPTDIEVIGKAFEAAQIAKCKGA